LSFSSQKYTLILPCTFSFQSFLLFDFLAPPLSRGLGSSGEKQVLTGSGDSPFVGVPSVDPEFLG
jgi:hypothetical protein